MSAKGKRGEYEARDVLASVFGVGFTRVLNQSRDGGGDCVSADEKILVEAKNQIRPDVWAALRQVDAARAEGQVAIVYAMRTLGRGKRSERLIALTPDNFRRLVEYLRVLFSTEASHSRESHLCQETESPRPVSDAEN